MVKWHKQSGFSLVELSVALAVIAVILGGALTIATKKTESDKVTETNNKIAKIEAALDVFLIENQRLPCPAQGAWAQSIAEFGMAGTASQSGGNGVCANDDFSTGNIHYGVVPTKTLNLPDDVMFDGWGRRFSYAVDARFANNTTTNGSCNGGTASGQKICFKYADTTTIDSIIISDGSGALRSDKAIYIIISHGKNGHGAFGYVGSGTRLAASSDAWEQENAGNDEGGFDDKFIQNSETDTFDDIVSYRTRWQMMDGNDLISDNDLCLQASTILNKSGTAHKVANCTGASSSANCELMADQVFAWCMEM